MNVKLFGLGTYSYLCLKFNSNCLWTHDNCCPNSLRPSFPIHSLQIYCHGLIGLTYPILRFRPQIETLQLALPVGKTYALVNVTVKYGRISQHQTNPHQAKPANSQQQDDFLNLERERDREKYREGSVHTTNTSRSHSRGGSHVSQRQDDNKAMQRKINDLKKKLRRVQRKRSPSNFNGSSNDEEDASHKRRSRTLPSEFFSCDEECYHRQKYKSPLHKGTGNDVINQTLNKISKSPFTCRIEGAKLLQRFHQPMFTIYKSCRTFELV